VESSVLAVVYVVGASLAASSCRRVAYAPAMYSVSSRGITGSYCRAKEMYALHMQYTESRPCVWANRLS
jgi:hypothetical protein